MTADSATIEGDLAIATGDVRLVRGKQALEAPELTYDRGANRAIAEQGLRYVREGISLDAETADVDIDDRTGTFGQTRFAVTANGGRGQAARIESLDNGTYRLTEADYTTCPGPDPAWQLTAETIRLDRTSGRGEAFDTVLHFFDWPVFYSPYLNFPIDDKRHTGFLTPTIGSSGDSGFELAAPFYINIAPGRDATVTPRLLTDRGLQLAGQFRYLNPHSTGSIEAEVLPSDQAYGDDRALLHIEHKGRLTPNIGLDANYSRASDDEYFEDLGSTLARTSQSQLEQRVRLTAASPGVRFALLGQDFQTLANDDDGPAFTRDPYARLPAAQLSLLSPTRHLQAGLDAEVVNFSHDNAVEGLRYNLRPRALWGMDTRGWYIQSEASYYYTRYDLDGPGRAVRNREIPSVSVDAGLRFQRLLDNGWIQTLEPRAKYLYNEHEAQGGLPLFDTGIPDLHYERLFADNRFTGNDRIGDANQVALGVTSRFIEPESGRTAVRLDLGRVYGFRDLEVRLPTRSPIGYGNRHSDIVANAEYRPAADWHTSATTQYDPDSERINRGAVRAGYDDRDRRRITVGYHFFRDLRPLPDGPGFETLEQTQLTAAWPLNEAWHAIGRWNYSLEKSQSVNTLAGLEYRASCCWALRGAWRRYVDDDEGEYDTAIMFQIEFTGLGRFGDDIESLLEHDIVSTDSDYDSLQFP